VTNEKTKPYNTSDRSVSQKKSSWRDFLSNVGGLTREISGASHLWQKKIFSSLEKRYRENVRPPVCVSLGVYQEIIIVTTDLRCNIERQ